MRALTLKPHWAHAVAWLGKRIENRSRPIPEKLVGQRVAIHAGAALPRGWIGELHKASPEPLQYESIFGMATGRVRRKGDVHEGRRPACRAIVATAVLGWCRESAQLHAPPWWSDADAAWWWRLDDVQRLTTPVPVQRGQLGLWTLDDEIAAAVEAAAWEAA